MIVKTIKDTETDITGTVVKKVRLSHPHYGLEEPENYYYYYYYYKI